MAHLPEGSPLMRAPEGLETRAQQPEQTVSLKASFPPLLELHAFPFHRAVWRGGSLISRLLPQNHGVSPQGHDRLKSGLPKRQSQHPGCKASSRFTPVPGNPAQPALRARAAFTDNLLEPFGMFGMFVCIRLCSQRYSASLLEVQDSPVGGDLPWSPGPA